jgi:hypothetical protein
MFYALLFVISGLTNSRTVQTGLFALCFVVSIGILTAYAQSPPLYLNEVMASNAATIEDEDGDAEDWIEIYYAGDEPLQLAGYGLSDDYDRPFRWTFPDVTVMPGEFLLVWASGKDRNVPGSPLHTNYSISAAGEEIILTAPDGTRLDELMPTAIPTDVSIGRQPDGVGDWVFFTSPTPGSTNNTKGFQETLEPVVFSHDGGFYTQSQINLTLSHPDPNASIIYTIDGSEPEPGNLGVRSYPYKARYGGGSTVGQDTYESLEYWSSIPITDRTSEPNVVSRMRSTFATEESPYYYPSHSIYKGTVIRAKAVKDGAIDSPTTTHTYFVTSQGRSRYSLPVVSIAVQRNFLFDYDDGIYVPGRVWDETNPWRFDGGAAANYNRRGIEWERPASIEIYEPDSEHAALRQNLGIRLHGGWSRAEPMKSLRLYARSVYGEGRFNHRIFPDLPYTEYNRLMMRNSGNDWPLTMFRDALMQRLVAHMNFDVQAYRPAVVFINGEYWGIHNFRERYDRHYLARVYGVDPDRVDILDGNASVKEGSNQHYIETIDYIDEHRLIENEHYEYIKTRIDVENFMDYQIAQIFLGNTDWPGNNMDYWRYQADGYQPDAPYGHDGRWRWLMYDTDFGFHLYSTPVHHNTLAFATEPNGPDWPNPSWSTFLLRRFLENQTFRNDFISRFADQLNTAFRPSRIQPIIDEMESYLEDEMAEHIDRWNRPGSMNSWRGEVNRLRNYAADRGTIMRNHLVSFFDLSVPVNLTVDVNTPSGGRVYVNTIEISPSTPGIGQNPFPWTGIYFRILPVTVKAKPHRGYRFSHWEGTDGDSLSPSIALSLTGPTTVKAVFVESEIFPVAHALKNGRYLFEEWSADEPADRYPDNIAFVYMDEADPGLEAEVAGFTSGAYNLDQRTRISGLGTGGFAFINTGNEDGNPGYPGTRLGGAILALDTRETSDIMISWVGSTILPNSRVYNIRLQYRVGNEGPFEDVLDHNGEPVEYWRRATENHRQTIGPVHIPPDAIDQSHVELFWRYYYTGQQTDDDSGQRAMMAVSRIVVGTPEQVTTADENTNVSLPDRFTLHQNYPNPFNPSTQIRFELPENGRVILTVHDILGRTVSTLVDEHMHAGVHTVTFDASRLAGGMYIYRLHTESFTESKRMLLIK